jgi:hypothetical protein
MDSKLRCPNAEFERLKKHWAELRKEQQNRERVDLPYNVFRLLRLERKEDDLHSPFLRDLLDPDGSHGQGLLFLRSFLDLLAKKLTATGVSSLSDIHRHFVDPSNREEWCVRTERDRINISIRNHRAELIISIENKIDAGEQEKQLCRYRNLLDDERAYKRRVLVFLTPGGYGDPKSGKPDVHLKYEQDIAPWLQEIEAKEELPTTVRNAVHQYHEIIEDMSGVRGMSKDEALIELLAKHENIRCALDISKSTGDVKRKLRLTFWEQIADNFVEHIAKSSLVDAWAVGGMITSAEI